MNPLPVHGRVVHTGLLLLLDEPLVVRDAIDEPERVARLEVGVPFLERGLVEELGDPVAGRHREVVVALRADVLPGLDFLLVDRGLALRATEPQTLRYSALRPLRRHARHSS